MSNGPFQNKNTFLHNKCLSVTDKSNITLLNNLLLNSYFENPTVGFHAIYVLNMHANFHVNRCNLPFNL